MSCAGATRTFELALERLPCSVEAHRGIVGRHAEVGSDLDDWPLLEVDLLNHLRVLGFERGKNSMHARADGLMKLGVLRLVRLLGELVHGAHFGALSPVVVHQRIAEQPVEPGDRALAFAWR